MAQFSKKRENNGNGRGSLIEFWLRVQIFLQTRSKIARDSGLRSREYEILLAVRAIPDAQHASVSVLAERLLLQHHVAAGVVKSLVNKRLLIAERNLNDRRSLALRLTEEGENLLRQIVAQSLRRLRTEGPPIKAALKRVIRTTSGSRPRTS